TARGSLLGADAAHGDIGLEIVFAADRGSGQSAQDGDLPDVSERVGNGTLKELRRLIRERLAGSKVIVKYLERGKEAVDALVPRERRRIVPRGLALGHRQRPVQQVAHVREDLSRSAH